MAATPAPLPAPAAALLSLMTAAQWAQLAEAIATVQAAGYGEVKLGFERGRPRVLVTTVERVYVSFDQVQPALAAVQQAGFGTVAVSVRDHRSIRLQVTTEARMVQPPRNGGPPS